MESLPSINSGVLTELLIPELWSVKKQFVTLAYWLKNLILIFYISFSSIVWWNECGFNNDFTIDYHKFEMII